jgi:hypothetical protein
VGGEGRDVCKEVAMTSRARYLVVFASLALGSCAAQTPSPSAAQWEMPVVPLKDVPRLTRAEMKANPPHPWVAYEDYTMEPTRFVFRPRNLPPEEHGDNADNGDNGDYGDFGYGDFGYGDFGGGMEGF